MKLDYIFLLLGIGAVISFIGIGSLASYAQEEEGASTVELSMSVLTTIVGMAIVLIPIIRREILASKYQNPAILKALQMGEEFGGLLLKDQAKFKELAEIAYSGLPKEYVDQIEGKPKVKLEQLNKDLLEAKIKYERFLEIYSSLRPAVSNEPILGVSTKTRKIADIE